MKLRFLVFCLALAMINLAARAQDNPSAVNAPSGTQIDVGPGDVGLYVNPVGIHITNSQADSGVFAFLGDNKTSRMFWGATFGGYVNFIHNPKFDAGIDFRDTAVTGNNANLNSFLVGGRILPKPIAEKFQALFAGIGGGGEFEASDEPDSPEPTGVWHLRRVGLYAGETC